MQQIGIQKSLSMEVKDFESAVQPCRRSELLGLGTTKHYKHCKFLLVPGYHKTLLDLPLARELVQQLCVRHANRRYIREVGQATCRTGCRVVRHLTLRLSCEPNRPMSSYQILIFRFKVGLICLRRCSFLVCRVMASDPEPRPTSTMQLPIQTL